MPPDLAWPLALQKRWSMLVAMTDSAIAIAALWGSIHNLRILVNRGLVRPEEVEEFAAAILEGLQCGDAGEAAIWEGELSPLFAEMKMKAAELYRS